MSPAHGHTPRPPGQPGPPGQQLAQRLEAARQRAFVGRTKELELFRAALRGDAGTLTVLALHGPGGIGKSMLLRRFAREAREAGRAVIEVEGHALHPSPAAFEAEAAGVLDDKAVLLVDTYERCQGLEEWLWSCFLPRLPVGALVVLAGRRPPDVRWTCDPGWAEALRVVGLRNLSPDESAALLHHLGVPPALRPSLLRFAGGHPLALSLAAAVAVKDEGAASSWAPSRDVAATLLPQLIGDVPSSAHRRALEVCAHAHMTDEKLLDAVLPERAGELFAWLRQLPFIESGPYGLYPHDVVRDALEADLRWRNREEYEAMHTRLLGELLLRVCRADEAEVLHAAGSFMYLLRNDGQAADYYTWRHEGETYEDTCRPEDRAAVLGLIAETEGEESAAVAEFWLDRQPEAFRVHRRSGTGEVVACMAWLKLREPTEEELAADPVVAAAWRHCRSTTPLRPGEHIGMERYLAYPPAQARSPVVDQLKWRSVAEIYRSNGLAWFYVVVADPDFWRPKLTHFDLQELGTRPSIGGRASALFAQDWREVPLRATVDAHDHGTPAAEPAKDISRNWDARLTVLSRPEFNAAVRDALRALGRPDTLAANPLSRSRVTIGRGGTDRGAALQGVVEQALDELGGDSRNEKRHRALVETYRRDPATQEATAERMGLPFSTYRRHLSGGTEWLCDRLWHWEIHGWDD